MNFLAHLLLSGDDPEMMTGNLMADFLKGENRLRYRARFQTGIRLHHRIDKFTDEHPVVARGKNRMPPPFRRYAGVLVDIFYDHFLARAWDQYCPDRSLRRFSAGVYDTLWEARDELPPRLRRVLPWMIGEDWLGSYAETAGIERTLKRLSKRPRRENPLAAGISQLEANYSQFRDDFHVFSPLLAAEARGWIGRAREADVRGNGRANGRAVSAVRETLGRMRSSR